MQCTKRNAADIRECICYYYIPFGNAMCILMRDSSRVACGSLPYRFWLSSVQRRWFCLNNKQRRSKKKKWISYKTQLAQAQAWAHAYRKHKNRLGILCCRGLSLCLSLPFCHCIATHRILSHAIWWASWENGRKVKCAALIRIQIQTAKKKMLPFPFLISAHSAHNGGSHCNATI